MPELKDSNSLKQRILEESKEYVVQPVQEGEFTIKFFAEVWDLSYDQARDTLIRMEKDGKVYKRVGVNTNGRCNVYGWREKR